MPAMAEEAEVVGHIVPGNYRLVRLISEGVPSLYEARHPRLVGPFSARLWPPTIFSEAFRRGAETAATLRHRGVVQVIDFHSENGEPPALITEWIEGARLSDVLRHRGLLPLARAASLAESTAWALAAAHERGVVHQSLRPESIFVVQAPGSTREWTKVDDFGVGAALARAGVAEPSPYRAPEQIAPSSDQAPDPRSDQFALAAIVYEMLSGVRPFDDGADARKGPPTPLSELVPDVGDAVDGVLGRALAPDPENRFPSIVAFAQALNEAVEGENTNVLFRPELSSSDRTPGPEVPALETLIPTPGPIIASPVDEPPFRPDAPAPWHEIPALLRPPPPRRRKPILIAVGLGAVVGLTLVAAHALRPQPKQQAQATAPAAAPVPAPAPAPAATGGPAAPPAAVAAAAKETAAAAPATPPEAEAPAPPAEESPPAPAIAIKVPEPTPPSRVHVSRPLRRRHPGTKVATSGHRFARAAGAGSGACTISVASSPPADIWLDNHKIGRRTPLDGYHVGCGTHELILNRDDLGLFRRETISVDAGAPFKKSYPLK
jgi:serine/threonine-protein kinase